MDHEKNKELIIVTLGGIFGIHKFIKGETKMGLLYLFTGGIFGIGWLIDIFKILANYSLNGSDSLMGREGIKVINEGKIPNIQGSNLNLAPGETCCYMDKAYTFKEKTVTSGYIKNNNGFSFRIMKGLSYHTSRGNSQAIRNTQRTIYKGLLYITTKRIIFSSQNENFDKLFEKITLVQETKNGVIIQIDSHIYSIVTKTHSEFMKVYNLLKQLSNNE